MIQGSTSCFKRDVIPVVIENWEARHLCTLMYWFDSGGDRWLVAVGDSGGSEYSR